MSEVSQGDSDPQFAAAVWGVAGRPTRIVVDLDRIAANINYFRKAVTLGTEVMAVVKADGYGHGAVMVARTAIDVGATHLAVATVDEGVALRRAELTAPILVLGPIDPSEVTIAAEHDLMPTLVDSTFVPIVAAAARKRRSGSPWQVHVKVDSGMHRFGARPNQVGAVFSRIAEYTEIQVAGLFTHFADADGVDDAFTREQAERFLASVSSVRGAGFSTGRVHLSNSAAALRWRWLDHDMVRIGIALYGLSPGPGVIPGRAVRPALSVWSRISRVSTISKGDSVSYGRTYHATKDESLGLVPIGYGDGYSRGLSSVGAMRVNGLDCPVRGRVCMDQTVIGLPQGALTRVGDQVEVISADESQPNSVAQLAKTLGTIDYEIATGLARRIPRIYTKGRRVVAVQDLHGVGQYGEP